jgi:hypothetical protein
VPGQFMVQTSPPQGGGPGDSLPHSRPRRRDAAVQDAVIMVTFCQNNGCRPPCAIAVRSVVNLAFACLLFPAAAVTAGVTAYRAFRSLAAGKRWTQRRRRLFGLYAVQVRNGTRHLGALRPTSLSQSVEGSPVKLQAEHS